MTTPVSFLYCLLYFVLYSMLLMLLYLIQRGYCLFDSLDFKTYRNFVFGSCRIGFRFCIPSCADGDFRSIFVKHCIDVRHDKAARLKRAQRDLNPRPTAPQAAILSKLNYGPTLYLSDS